MPLLESFSALVDFFLARISGLFAFEMVLPGMESLLKASSDWKKI
jgi:hypothetical protein